MLLKIGLFLLIIGCGNQNNKAQVAKPTNEKFKKLPKEQKDIINKINNIYDIILLEKKSTPEDLDKIKRDINEIGIFNILKLESELESEFGSELESDSDSDSDLDSDSDPNSKETILNCAINNAEYDIANLILEILSHEKDKQKVKEFIDQKFRGVAPIYRAVNAGKISLIEKLIELGADMDAQTFGGDTPLHLAVMDNMIEILKFLIKKGANKNIKNNKGITPLELAILTKRAQALELLKE